MIEPAHRSIRGEGRVTGGPPERRTCPVEKGTVQTARSDLGLHLGSIFEGRRTKGSTCASQLEGHGGLFADFVFLARLPARPYGLTLLWQSAMPAVLKPKTRSKRSLEP